MLHEKMMPCAFCEKSFIRAWPSNTLYCSAECRFMQVAAQFNGIDGCWNWPGSVNVETGYGQFMTRENGRSRLRSVHRFSFECFVGPILNGLQTLHRCDNRRCFNPAHLFSGTQKENIDDMFSKGRQAPYPRRLAISSALSLK